MFQELIPLTLDLSARQILRWFWLGCAATWMNESVECQEGDVILKEKEGESDLESKKI